MAHMPHTCERVVMQFILNYRVSENGLNRHRQIPDAATQDLVSFLVFIVLFIQLKIYEIVKTAQ
jgi:hypothetical protein